MKRLCIAIVLIVSLIYGCVPYYYDSIVDVVENAADIPQEGGIITLPLTFQLVQTKFEPGYKRQDLRYRALINGIEYSYAVNNYVDNFLQSDTSYIKIVVPWNDSYEERKIRVDVSISEDFEKVVWGEWKTVFESTQLGLQPGETQKYSHLDDYVVTVVVDGIELKMDLFDTIASQCFKSLFLEGEREYKGDSSYREVSLKSGLMHDKVPISFCTLTRCDAGDVLLDQNGKLAIRSQPGGIQNNALTYIGKLTRNSIADLQNYCDKTDERAKAINDRNFVKVRGDGYHVYCPMSIRLDKR